MKSNIPFFGAPREYASLSKNILREVQKVFIAGQPLQGGAVTDLETQLAKAANRTYGIAVNSCTDALYFALMAAGIVPGDEVLVTDFSFIASASCIARAGAKPVFVDIGKDYNIDLTRAAHAITPKSKVLIGVHLFGQMIDPALLEDFCVRNHLRLIEDAAQAFGSTYNGRPVGSVGLASCLSFDPTTPLSAPGSGGIVLTNDAAVAQRVRRLRYHGREEKPLVFAELGFNSQMPTLTAAVLNFKLKKAPQWLERRREIAAFYTKELSRVGGITLPRETLAGSHNYHKYVIRCADRDALRESLSQAGIETLIHYELPLHRQPCFSNFRYDDSAFPQAHDAARHVLSLPIHPFLTDKEIETIARIFDQHYR